jgi:glycosyltransferase involved in cell wall biosynthesis
MRISVITLNFNTKNGGGSHLTLDLLLKFLFEKGHSVSLIASNITLGEEKPKYKIIQEKIDGDFLETLDKTQEILKKYEGDSDLYLIYGASMIYSGGKYKKSGGKLPVAVYINSYLPSLGIVKPDLQNLNIIKKISYYTKFKLHYLKHLIWDKLFGLKLVNFINLIIFDSPSILEIYTKFGFPKFKSIVEPELIDTEKIISESGKHKEIFSDKIRFIYVGRLLFDKGVDILIKATSLLKHRDDFSVTIVGKGAQKEYLEKIIKKNKLEKIVKIYPWQT